MELVRVNIQHTLTKRNAGVVYHFRTKGERNPIITYLDDVTVRHHIRALLQYIQLIMIK